MPTDERRELAKYCSQHLYDAEAFERLCNAVRPMAYAVMKLHKNIIPYYDKINIGCGSMNILLLISLILITTSIILILLSFLMKDSYTYKLNYRDSYKFAILIPAKDESKVIRNLLDSINKQVNIRQKSISEIAKYTFCHRIAYRSGTDLYSCIIKGMKSPDKAFY